MQMFFAMLMDYLTSAVTLFLLSGAGLMLGALLVTGGMYAYQGDAGGWIMMLLGAVGLVLASRIMRRTR